MEEELEIINEKDISNNIKIKSVRNFVNKINKNDLNNDNIYIKYLEDPNIIFQNKDDINNNNLKLLFNELKKDMEEGNNILFPFLDIFPNLIKAYIESDLDDFNNVENNKIYTISESIYLKTFEHLKNNCFISKEALFPIYDYFKYLYDMESKELKKEDEVFLKKFKKMVKLFEIFYESNNLKKENNLSSYCFIGGSICLEFNEEFDILKIFPIEIKINILNSDYLYNINDESFLIKINDEEIKNKDLKKNCIEQKLKIINFLIDSNNIKVNFKFEKKNFGFTEKVKLKKIKSIILLESFYGQISSIKLSIGKINNNKEYDFTPFLLRNENTIFPRNINKISEDKLKRLLPIIKIDNTNLVNINYINYNDSKFDIIDYYGGIIQFLPFYLIIKKLIEISNGKDNKYKDLNDDINYFSNFIIKLIIKKLFSTKDKRKLFKKHIYFVYYILLDLNIFLTVNIEEYEEKKDEYEGIYNCLDLLIMIYYNQLNQFSSKIKELIKEFNKDKNNSNLNYFKKPKKSLNQIYKEYMKSIFCFNNFWSKRNIFYPKSYNNYNNRSIKIKYKQLNYYTKNFQIPYFYPILEYKKYYPEFKSFKGQIFKEDENNILNYDFELNYNKKSVDILKALVSKSNKSIKIKEKCCLILNTHHIFGKITCNVRKNNNFIIIFKNIKKRKKEEYKKCNKYNPNENKIKNISKIVFYNNNEFSDLCYGAIFPFTEKHKKNIIINSKYILFVLVRIYYHRVSAIEIFTINKSYYFNFHNSFEVNNYKSNTILNVFINNSLFREIKLHGKLILGYYNIKYKPYLFPLFEDEINHWDKKVNYFCNYDILTLINIFSNRSFRDVFQYPIFPTLYISIKKKRELDKHIGFQDITRESKKRRNIYLVKYEDKMEDKIKNKNFTEEVVLFTIHYSNPAYVFNYLLRLLPYTFLSIEFQGDGFDNPNRLFFSIEKTLISSLNMMTDLREMIPELYYMIELFYNKNNIFFEKIFDGRSIDNIFIKEDENIESYIKQKEKYGKFLYEMRKGLEDETDINKWIDLIFGIKKKFYENGKDKYQYYEKCSEIDFSNKNPFLIDELSMEKVNFGLLPYQIFNKEFPQIPVKTNEIIKELKLLNEELFIDEHIKINSRNHTFLCKGRILIDENYIRIINPNKKINILDYYYNLRNNNSINDNLLEINNDLFKNNFGFLNFDIDKKKNSKYKDKMSLVNYYFFGNIFGKLSIYSLKEACENDYETEDINSSFVIMMKDSKNAKLPLKIEQIKCLYNHTKEIKYIDFNSRLNILLSYSLDNFINIYIFPKLKLINEIDTKEFKDENDKNYFDAVILLSFPFPSIICHNKEFIYMLSINGELIKYEKLEEGEKIIYSIDKNLGIVEDHVEIFKEGKIKSVFNIFKD